MVETSSRLPSVPVNGAEAAAGGAKNDKMGGNSMPHNLCGRRCTVAFTTFPTAMARSMGAVAIRYHVSKKYIKVKERKKHKKAQYRKMQRGITTNTTTKAGQSQTQRKQRGCIYESKAHGSNVRTIEVNFIVKFIVGSTRRQG